jgi:hypothetical protein
MKKYLILFFPLLLLYLIADQYLFCPSFTFQNPKSFSGNTIYNPFKDFNAADWKKSNFHAHCRAWNGITNGKGIAPDIWKAFDSLGYTFHSISNYHYIDTNYSTQPNYIGAYEHGVNLKKTHQLVLNAQAVVWKDYFFPQTLNNKQHILSLEAADTNAVVILNHPLMRNGYNTTDLKLLQGYDAIEVLNPAAQSFAHLDTALSNGHRIALIGNDDLHDIADRTSAGRFGTLLFAPNSLNYEALSAIKNGKTIAFEAPDQPDFKRKIEQISLVNPQIKSIETINDTVVLNFNVPVSSFKAIGQNGKILFEQDTITNTSIPFAPTESYIRFQYKSADGVLFYLSPLFRYDSKFPTKQVQYNKGVTHNNSFYNNGIIRFIFLVLCIVLMKNMFKRRKTTDATNPS